MHYNTSNVHFKRPQKSHSTKHRSVCRFQEYKICLCRCALANVFLISCQWKEKNMSVNYFCFSTCAAALKSAYPFSYLPFRAFSTCDLRSKELLGHTQRNCWLHPTERHSPMLLLKRGLPFREAVVEERQIPFPFGFVELVMQFFGYCTLFASHALFQTPQTVILKHNRCFQNQKLGKNLCFKIGL